MAVAGCARAGFGVGGEPSDGRPAEPQRITDTARPELPRVLDALGPVGDGVLPVHLVSSQNDVCAKAAPGTLTAGKEYVVSVNTAGAASDYPAACGALPDVVMALQIPSGSKISVLGKGGTGSVALMPGLVCPPAPFACATFECNGGFGFLSASTPGVTYLVAYRDPTAGACIISLTAN